jgi:pyruvate-ferredoxin/flavodoxin oxidoreductase
MTRATVDGNEAAASVAYRLNEVCCIYPITPSSPMAELADEWSSQKRPNLWGGVPSVVEMQHEGGAAGALHGALQSGALATTFTASQGLLLMIPNMYKIAGELTPAVLHVAARSLAAQGLSIFGDHSDVMAVRQTGFALLASASVQEAHDLALVAQAATLATRVPFVHFFDGFRTSHELNTIEMLTDDDLRALVPEALIRAHRGRGLSPERPFIRGTAQNPDVYFQARETVNPFYDAVPGAVQEAMDGLAARTGRRYHTMDYTGHPEAERVIVVMGSAAETIAETVTYLCGQGERVGMLQVRLYRPFPAQALLDALPASAGRIAVLDRTKEPGSNGEPLFLDVVAALAEAHTRGERAVLPLVTGGRYGLSSKELTPGMVAGVFAELARERPRPRFTIGIHDDVSGLSLPYDPSLDIEPPSTIRAVFFGLGSDGTVGANKNTIKILGAEENLNAQGYFVYDSKKSGSQTVSHLRFGPQPIRAPYLVQQAGFVGCHHFGLLDRVDVLALAAPGATLLLDCKLPGDEVWDALPRPVQEKIIAKRVEVYAIDAGRIARAAGLAGRTNTVLQTCFFAISGVLPREEAIAKIKTSIAKTYGRRGAEVVARNHAAVDATLEGLHQIEVPGRVTSARELPAMVPASAPEFVRTVTAMMMAGRGDELPVSALPVDGTYPSGTTAYEKRNISELVAEWDPDLCIQCGNCSFVCPHSVIRATYYDESLLKEAPSDFKSAPLDARGLPDTRFTLQVLRGGLHRMRAVRAGVPGRGARQPRTQGDQPRASRAAGGRRAGQRRVLRDAAGGRPVPGGLRHRTRHAVPAAAVRVLRRLRGLRRDAVRQAAFAAVRRPANGRERHRLLLDLRREPAHHAVDDQRRRARPGLVELAVRGQRRVRPGIPAGRRPARRAGPHPPDGAARRRRRRPGGRHPRRVTAERVGTGGPARPGRRAEAAARGPGPGLRACRRSAQRGRSPDPAQCLDRRRGRLGLRHRLLGFGPRAGHRAQRERAGA